MLVVVTIMMLLIAAAATRMRPATEARRIREAARALEVYLGSARNRAMETGRPCGVVLHRFMAGLTPTSAVMNLDQCEVPPCYSGDTTDAAMQFTSVSTVAGLLTVQTTTPSSSFNNNIVFLGDLIQFDFQGPLFQITAVNVVLGNVVLTATLDVSQGQLVPWSTASPPVPYRIYRLPSSSGATTFKGHAQPLQLPTSTVVDLAPSGIDGAATPFDTFDPSTGNANYGHDVAIVFSPNGSIYGAYYVGRSSTSVTQPIFFLLGKRERIPPPAYVATDPTTWANWQDLTNLWVVVNPQTGLVTSGEVAVGGAAGISGARVLARDAQGMGGK
jgi:type II secretory pathway pseudopilin PulG